MDEDAFFKLIPKLKKKKDSVLYRESDSQTISCISSDIGCHQLYSSFSFIVDLFLLATNLK